MQYFTEDFLSFFKELAQNNHKDWFHANKKRYESSIKKPFERFIGDMITSIQKYDSELQIEPKNCILRINKDIRFSKDKSPYNLHYTAFISRAGRKDKSIPGIFLRFSPEMIGIMGGCFGPSKEQLYNIRSAISKDSSTIKSLLSNEGFIEKFGEIRGETMKRIPKEWQEACIKEPLITNKQFYFVAEETPDLITKESLLDTLMDYWLVMRPLNDYLTKIIQ
ncbi:DUF2461 domain-containing protein [Aquimarina sp. 2201CG5-10]|uniref:DUF2461 domain-containing protein n=1 Tax=Aquimarina callyspongiae TaxID=3098150 RepID=UPI002AB4185A|nr:DUF2461 domain-containing protein [Aquimarina sp. 2201CG5-10]MDY8137096.1 DUF2461 domain-containing protein [Aquimarina sp. 2201CG5-10]